MWCAYYRFVPAVYAYQILSYITGDTETYSGNDKELFGDPVEGFLYLALVN